MKLKSNLKAPNFKLPSTGKTIFELNKIKKNIILYFYPKDDTPGCTIEAKDFSKLNSLISKNKTCVFGISKDSIEIFEEEGKLTIVGDRNEEDTSDEELWHYNGLAQRRFSRSFNLAPNVEITNVTLENGILVLRFEKDDNKNRKMIQIQ